MNPIREMWRAITGRNPVPSPVRPEVVVHDPDADRPHDLDDPFADPEVQSRIGGVIADSKTRKN